MRSVVPSALGLRPRHSVCSKRAVTGAPKRCLLCGSEHVNVTESLGTFTIACLFCGATLAYTPRPVDDPTLAGRIEMLVEPFDKRTAAKRDPDEALVSPKRRRSPKTTG